MFSVLMSSALAYELETEMSGNNFFEHFNYFTDYSPTGGWVDYSDASSGLTTVENGKAMIRVETTENIGNRKRKAIRLHSKKNWREGLFIADIDHMPDGCATWPAYWFYDTTQAWPIGGEIDVIEYTNGDLHNAATLHTTSQCSFNTHDPAYGNLKQPNCDHHINGNQGCGFQNPSSKTASAGFNNNGGGVIAMELVQGSDGWIKVWQWDRSNTPADVTSGSPNPDSWGTPLANWNFGSHCTSDHFSFQTMIFNTELCGGWAGADWCYKGQFNCDQTTGRSCIDHVKYNGKAFEDAYWAINYVKVFQGRDGPVPPAPTSCTALGDDPYASGSFVECCGGSKKCLEASANWAYRCRDCDGTCPDDNEWNTRTCPAVPTARPTQAPVAPTPAPGTGYCQPKAGLDVSGAKDWVCNNSGIDCTDTPTDCSSAADKASWAFSKYYAERASQHGDCNFDGQGEITLTPSNPKCVFGYQFCVPKSAPPSLDDALGWACREGTDCSDTPSQCTSAADRASWAFSKYYAQNVGNHASCDFGGNAELRSDVNRACVYTSSRRRIEELPAPGL